MPRAILLLGLLATACAGPGHRVLRPALDAQVWPRPPETPRARFLTSFTGERTDEQSGLQWLFSLITGASRSGDRVLARPFGVAARGDTLLVADPEGPIVIRGNWREGTSQEIHCGAQEWRAPMAVALHADGTSFVVDSEAGCVVRIALDGRCTVFGQGQLQRPTGVAVLGDRIFVADPPAHRLVTFSTTGTDPRYIGERGEGAGQFNYPTAVAAAPDGTLAVVDALNFRVVRLSADGVYLAAFGHPGDEEGEFGRPKGIAAAANGQFYVSDAQFDVVLAFTADGAFEYVLGESGPLPGQLQFPAGLAFDEGRLFIANALAHRVDIYELVERSRS